MNLEFEGVKYQIIFASDLERDGMALELSKIEAVNGEVEVEIFYSDVSREFSVDCFQNHVPSGLLGQLLEIAKLRLPSIEKP